VGSHRYTIKPSGFAEGSYFLFQPTQSIQFRLNRRIAVFLYFPGADQSLFRNPTHFMKQLANLSF
jgi:hypothetical protein